MRPGQQNKRMRGRGRKGPNPLSRSYESNGPDVKIRGTAQHIAEKYAALARDASASGDRVVAENYLQHAEHYNRIIAAAQAQFQPQREERDSRDSDDDEDYEGQDNQFARSDRRQGNGDGRDQFDRQSVNGVGPQPYVNGPGSGEAGQGDAQMRYRSERGRRDDTPSENRGRANGEESRAGAGEDESGLGRRRGRSRRNRDTDTVTGDTATPIEAAAEAPEAPVAAAPQVVASEPDDAPAEKPVRRRRTTKPATPEPAAEAAPAAEDKPKRKPGRPRKKKSDEASDAEGNELPSFLLASNG
ncbi:DUF4167 domain-containing protein [Consotaella aegiceratis]|uniref:DUF4167 domain-containing protein n=1 Tax=Consotaella aegiceratis TaxID=3097961 RepID=UPI002F3FCB22